MTRFRNDTAGARLAAAVLVTLALVVGTAACGGRTGTGASEPRAAASASYPVTIGDTTLSRRPERIVSLAPTATEMLFKIGAGRQVAAVDDQSNFPAEAPHTNLSGFKPSAEAIAAKQPDLVVISNDIDKIKSQLAQLKIPVYLAAAAATLDDTYREMTDLGRLTGHPAEATDQVDQMRTDIAATVKNTPRPSRTLSYYYELDPTRYSVTSKTFVGSLFAQFGLHNIADDADPSGAANGYPQLSAEALVKGNPDLIFLADKKCCGQTPDAVGRRPGFANIAAVKSRHVYGLDDDVASRWGPRVVELMRDISDALRGATP